jgi:hypothetical protein
MLPIIAESIGSLVMGLIHKFLPDTTQEKKDAINAALQAGLAQVEIDKAQIKVNETEAAQSNLLVAGWRPFIGWVCGIAFAWQYLLCPVLSFLLAAIGHPLTVVPELGLDAMLPVLMGMLGLGGLRTYEKVQRGK